MSQIGPFAKQPKIACRKQSSLFVFEKTQYFEYSCIRPDVQKPTPAMIGLAHTTAKVNLSTISLQEGPS
jgi:hypothetical protein